MAYIKNSISLREASDITGYHPDYLSQLIRKKKLHGSKIGRNWFTTPEAVKQYLSSQKFVPATTILSAKKHSLLAMAVYAILIMSAVGSVFAYFFEQANSSEKISVKESALEAASGTAGKILQE